MCLQRPKGFLVLRKFRKTASAVCLCSLVIKLGGACKRKKKNRWSRKIGEKTGDKENLPAKFERLFPAQESDFPPFFAQEEVLTAKKRCLKVEKGRKIEAKIVPRSVKAGLFTFLAVRNFSAGSHATSFTEYFRAAKSRNLAVKVNKCAFFSAALPHLKPSAEFQPPERQCTCRVTRF